MAKNKTIPVACLIVLSLAFAGCGSSYTKTTSAPLHEVAPGGARGAITIWSWNIAAEALKAITPAYEVRQPNVHVNVDMTGADMTMRFMLCLAAGTGAPDVSQLQMSDVRHYIATNCLEDLTSVAAKYQNSFPPALWQTCVSKGHVYAIPWDMGPCGVFYKKSIFAKYGIDPSKIETWDDYIAAGVKILKLSGGKTKLLPLASSDVSGMMSIIMQQTGGQVFDDQGRIAIDSPQNKVALAIVKKMIQSGICSNVQSFSQEWMAGMNDDSVASYINGVWLGGTIEDSMNDGPDKNNIWAVFRLPAVTPGGLRVANNGGSVLVIPMQSKQKEAAWSFIEYALCTKDGQIAQFQKKSLFPSYLPAMRSRAVAGPEPFYGGQPIGTVFGMDVTKIPHTNMTPEWAEANDYVSQDLTHWEATGMDNPLVLKSLAQKLSERLDVPIAPGGLS